MSGRVHSQVSDDPADWLGETSYINVSHRRVKDTALAVTGGARDDREKALALFAHVRDNIRFGFAAGFWDNKASDVLKSGRGYCNTQSTAYVALLRAAGIPARQVFVDIDASVLFGILDPGTPFVDHSYVEVFLADAWVMTDAYIVDPPLFVSAQRKLHDEGRLMGYGVHSTGQNDWDGRSASFSQYNILDSRPLGTRRWGVYADVGDFYRNADGVWNRLNPLLRLSMGTLAARANRRAEAFRQ